MREKPVLLCLVASLAIPAKAPAEIPGPSPTPASPPIQATARADKKEVTIGTPIKYTLEVRGSGQVEVVVPVLSGSLGSFAITDFGEEPAGEDGSGVLSSRWYKLVAYSPGDYVVPGPPIQYRVPGGELETVNANDVPVTVRSLLEGTDDPAKLDIHDIKQPIEVPFDWRPVGMALAVVAALGLVGWAVYRWANRRHFSPASVAPRPSHEVALEALARLRLRKLVEEGRIEEYYVELSSIVRRYLEGRFSLNAPEMTTEEFLQTVQGGASLRPDHRRLLGGFLNESDLVKFARHEPATAEAERAFEAARRFVDESRPEG